MSLLSSTPLLLSAASSEPPSVLSKDCCGEVTGTIKSLSLKRWVTASEISAYMFVLVCVCTFVHTHKVHMHGFQHDITDLQTCLQHGEDGSHSSLLQLPRSKVNQHRTWHTTQSPVKSNRERERERERERGRGRERGRERG